VSFIKYLQQYGWGINSSKTHYCSGGFGFLMLHDDTVVWSSRIIMPQCKKNCQELNTQTYSIISQKNTHLKIVTAQQLTASFSQILIINPTGVHFIRYVEVYATYVIKLFLGRRVETEATYCLHLNSYIKFIWHTVNCCLLGYDTVRFGRSEMTFWRIPLPPSSPDLILKEHVSPKHWYTSTRLHGVTFQKKFSMSLLWETQFSRIVIIW